MFILVFKNENPFRPIEEIFQGSRNNDFLVDRIIPESQIEKTVIMDLLDKIMEDANGINKSEFNPYEKIRRKRALDEFRKSKKGSSYYKCTIVYHKITADVNYLSSFFKVLS